MSRICLLFILFGSLFHTKVNAQDFSIDELVQLRAGNLSVFETAVMAKGYEIADVSSGYDRYVTFRKEDDIIAFGYIRNAHSQATDTVVIYRTRDLDGYKKLQAQKKETTEHPDIMHFIAGESHIRHAYIDGKVCLHFRTRRGHGAQYEVKVMPDNTDKYYHYSSLNGSIDW
ncbi:MAG: hypothetical protein K0Q79_3551 [Flavipsychrobacter sp.]|jgi:hypothetical protein|nr:hypothetical protein [Flavipsychrobacter sp.]